MVLRERIAEHIYVFRSGLYAQVNAGLIATNEGCVLIDTLPFPQETAEIVDFVRSRLRSKVRYVILTHSHADHVYGAYLFPQAEIVGHRFSRELMVRQTRQALIEARQKNAALAEVTLKLPTLLTEREASIRIGGFTLVLHHAPGHSPDILTVYVKEEKVLFASDAVMPVPYLVSGSLADMRRSLHEIRNLAPVEDVVQGHGDVLLRGEVQSVLQAQVLYLNKIEAFVADVAASGGGKRELDRTDIEQFGLSRASMGGLVQQLHLNNLHFLLNIERKRQQQV